MDQCAFLISDSAPSSLGSPPATPELPNSTSPIEPSQPLSHTNYTLVKKKLLHELSALLQLSTLIALRGWRSECSVQPVGPCNQKNSFINPLMGHFWCHYNRLLLMDLHTLRSTARAQSSCSIAFDDLLYGALQILISNQVFCKILNVQAVNFVDSLPPKLDESFFPHRQRCADHLCNHNQASCSVRLL